MAKTTKAHPSRITTGAIYNLLKLNISGEKLEGSELPPPASSMKPRTITPKPRIIQRRFFLGRAKLLLSAIILSSKNIACPQTWPSFS